MGDLRGHLQRTLPAPRTLYQPVGLMKPLARSPQPMVFSAAPGFF